MLDKEEFENGGKSYDQIVQEAIKGPLLDDFTKEFNRRVLADLEAFAKTGKAIITDAPFTFIPISEPS